MAGAFFVAEIITLPTEPFPLSIASFSSMANVVTGYWELCTKYLSRDEREEALWIDRARTGDEAAYRWLLGQYRSRVVRLAAHVLRGSSDAEDIAQDTFVRAFQQIGKFRGQGRFSAWLFSITVHLCLDRRRAASFGREVPAEAAPEAGSADMPPETRLLIEALLDQLTPPMRAALILREIEGLEYDEISAALGIPVGTVRSRLHTARAQFRDLWTAAETEANSHV